jgi:hypothetical protein
MQQQSTTIVYNYCLQLKIYNYSLLPVYNHSLQTQSTTIVYNYIQQLVYNYSLQLQSTTTVYKYSLQWNRTTDSINNPNTFL